MTNIDTATYLKENQGLIKKIAYQFRPDRMAATAKFSINDLLQEANLAALKALEGYDPTKSKGKLSTYVYKAVHRSCRDFVRRNKHDLYVSSYQQTKDWRASQASSKSKVDEVVVAPRFGSTIGPMAVRGDCDSAKIEGESFMMTIASGDASVVDSLIKKEQVAILQEEIDGLPERERNIIKARFINGLKLSEIARDQGVTRQRIDQISRRAMNRLTERVKDKLGEAILI